MSVREIKKNTMKLPKNKKIKIKNSKKDFCMSSLTANGPNQI